MRQFDVCKNLAGSPDRHPYVILLQSELIRTTGTQIVAPLDRSSHYNQSLKLYPQLVVEDEPWLIILPYMASLPEHMIGDAVVSAADIRTDIITAIDRLFTGV